MRANWLGPVGTLDADLSKYAQNLVYAGNGTGKSFLTRAHGAEPSHTTGHAIRCVLEAVGRFCHPDKCDSLSNYISYLAGEEGFEIKSVLINNLSHGTYYDETPSPDELRDACDEAVRIVEKYAKGQLEVARAMNGA